jgi:hypothetical protein
MPHWTTVCRKSLFFVCALLFTDGARAQEPDEGPERPSVTAVRVADGEAITLDGRFDEPVWRRAIPAANFRQQIPQTGGVPTELTEVRLAYTADALYMAVLCFDDEPDKLLGNTMKRDEGLRADDRFMWIIDPFLDGRSGYFFEMNPSGLMADSLMNTGGQTNRDWDGIWNARVHRSEMGWAIEIELPFRTFNFDPNGDAWGVNFQRTVRRKNEESLWTAWGLNQGLKIQYTGLLLGIRDVTQGHGLDLRPYGVASALAAPGRGQSRTETDADAGIDVYYSVTPKLRANVTVNTDFGETEVDQRQVNLTQYSLFFPEKRGFFLEGASYFDFASFETGNNNRNVSVVPFFSRRIGLDSSGDPQKIDLGVKLTGQIGRQDIGLMQIRTAREDGAPGEDFTALRVRRNVFRQSYVGALYTRRDARTHESATPLVAPLGTYTALDTLGADFRLGTTTFLRDQNLEMSGYYLTTTNPLKRGQNAAWGSNLEYPNDRYTGGVSYREVQQNYDPAVGFTLRTGYRRYAPRFRFQPRPRRLQGRTRFGVQQYQFGFSGDLQYLTATNDPLLRQWDITVFQTNFQSQEQIQVHVIPTYERLDRNFTISRGVTLPVGSDYDYTRYRFQVRTADRRMFAVNAQLETGSFYSGDRNQLSFDIGIRPRRGIVWYIYTEWNTVALPEGRFATRLYRTILDTQFNPWVQLSNNIQYDSVSAVLGWQSRFRWILTPGNDLYVVYNHNWLDDPLQNRFATLDRRASSKVLYTYRF